MRTGLPRTRNSTRPRVLNHLPMCTSLHSAGVEIGENKCGRLVSDIRPFALKIHLFRTAGPGAVHRVSTVHVLRECEDMCDADILLIFYLHS